MKAWVLRQLFRFWTALAVLAGYVYAWWSVPEALTWWKRTTTGAIERICDWLPYPWGDRTEASIGNFGLWVQITIAIVVFRVVIWFTVRALRHTFERASGRGRRRKLGASDRIGR
jgi:hypothetical protein